MMNDGSGRRIFVDLDGVLADFDRGFLETFGVDPRKFEYDEGTESFWQRVREHGSFYRDLPLMPDARQLWEHVLTLDSEATVLTGVPRGEWAAPQKVAWVAEHLGHARVITGPSREKCAHGRPGDVLIDDWIKWRHLWEEMGGTFVLHVGAAQSIAELDALVRRSV